MFQFKLQICVMLRLSGNLCTCIFNPCALFQAFGRRAWIVTLVAKVKKQLFPYIHIQCAWKKYVERNINNNTFISKINIIQWFQYCNLTKTTICYNCRDNYTFSYVKWNYFNRTAIRVLNRTPIRVLNQTVIRALNLTAIRVLSLHIALCWLKYSTDEPVHCAKF